MLVATGLLTTLVSAALAADLHLQPKLSKRAPPDLTFNTISTTQASDVASTSYDYIIVGGGTAALAVAARLAEADQDTSILVIEAGTGGDGVEDRILPPANAYFNGIAYPSSPYDWSYYTSNQTELSSRQVFWPRGKLLGGSSAVNGVYMTRASKREHDVWASLNNGTAWNFDDILPYYIKHETYETPSSGYSDRAGGIVVDSDNHGSSGPIHYAYAGYLYNQIGSWIRTFRNLGVPTGDPASGVTTGAYLSTSAIRGSDQTRSYSRTGYFETRPGNVRILTGYQVTQVNFNTSGSTPTATGVSFRQSRDGQAYTATARREVILSAGVIGSPQLLQLSGVGPADLLNNVGIDVVHDLPGVGAHLSDHLASSVTFSSSAAVTGDLLQSNSTFNHSQYRLWENGNGNQSLYSAPNQAIAYLNLSTLLGGTSNASSYITDLRDAMDSYMEDRGISGTTAAGYEAIYDAEITSLLETGEAAVEILMTNTGWNNGESGKTTTIQFALQHPFSRGWVNITSSDAFTIPRIDPGYLTHPSDIIIMRAALRYARRVAQTSPLSDILGGELSPGNSVSSNDSIDDYILSSGSTEYHPAGTCAMLPLRYGGVVDEQLRVYGINDLRVIDSSIIPVGLAAHLTSPTYAIAEKGAALLLSATSDSSGSTIASSTSAGSSSTSGPIGNAANAAPTSSNVASSASSLAVSSPLLLLLASLVLLSL